MTFYHLILLELLNALKRNTDNGFPIGKNLMGKKNYTLLIYREVFCEWLLLDKSCQGGNILSFKSMKAMLKNAGAQARFQAFWK